MERLSLNPAATFASGTGQKEHEEEPCELRTCFEHNRDHIVHSASLRGLAGRTQVVAHLTGHQRTRLTHAIEMTQYAITMARGIGTSLALTDAMALGCSCGHGPDGHTSEDAFDAFLPGGYDHGPWGASVVLKGLNLASQTLGGTRNHPWLRPASATLERKLAGWADRIAYCAHDLEDATAAGIITAAGLPRVVIDVVGVARCVQLAWSIGAVIETIMATDVVSMDPLTAEVLDKLHRFNYERICTCLESVVRSYIVVKVLHGLIEYFLEHPKQLLAGHRTGNATHGAVTYVRGMTDRFALDHTEHLPGWDWALLPKGIGWGA